MGEVGSLLLTTGVIVALVGGCILVSVFAWFSRHGGDVEVDSSARSTGGLLAPLVGLVILAGILAGIFRLLRPYLH